MNLSELYEPDEEGFYDIACRKCDGTEFVVQANIDNKTLRIICFKCKREVAFHVESYVEDAENNFKGS